MGIKFLAPQSKAAEFIDSQLNKVIQLIAGEDTEYSVIAAQVRTEPMEDKTDLINAQKGKNKGKKYHRFFMAYSRLTHAGGMVLWGQPEV